MALDLHKRSHNARALSQHHLRQIRVQESLPTRTGNLQYSTLHSHFFSNSTPQYLSPFAYLVTLPHPHSLPPRTSCSKERVALRRARPTKRPYAPPMMFYPAPAITTATPVPGQAYLKATSSLSSSQSTAFEDLNFRYLQYTKEMVEKYQKMGRKSNEGDIAFYWVVQARRDYPDGYPLWHLLIEQVH